MQGVVNAIFQPPNIYADLIIQPMAMYYWASKEWLPLLATEWSFQDGDTFQVKLRQGAKWSDGNEITANDVLATFSCARLMAVTVWDYIDQVTAVDDYTVNFHMSVPSTVVERYVLKFNTLSAVDYGEWAAKADDLFGSGKTLDDPEGKQLLDQFVKFRPDNVIASGPFMFDVNSFTVSQNTLLKNEQWPGTPTTSSSTGSSTTRARRPTSPRSCSPRTSTTPPTASRRRPCNSSWRRRKSASCGRPPTTAIASISTTTRSTTSLATSGCARRWLTPSTANRTGRSPWGVGRRHQYMSGMSDVMIPDWLSEEDAASLNQYEYDVEKAAALLEEVGWTKDGDTWKTPDGKDAAWEIVFPAEYVDSAGCASTSSSSWGTSASSWNRAPSPTRIGSRLRPGEVRIFWSSSGERRRTPTRTLRLRPRPLLAQHPGDPQRRQGLRLSAEAADRRPGRGRPRATRDRLRLGLDEEAQKANIGKIARAFNELLPAIPMYERYGANPAVEGVRVKAWPAEDDPILINSPYGDGIPTMLLYTGKLEPV